MLKGNHALYVFKDTKLACFKSSFFMFTGPLFSLTDGMCKDFIDLSQCLSILKDGQTGFFQCLGLSTVYRGSVRQLNTALCEIWKTEFLVMEPVRLMAIETVLRFLLVLFLFVLLLSKDTNE